MKKKVVDAPEILAVIDTIPHLSSFLNSLYACSYGAFFQVLFEPSALSGQMILWSRFSRPHM